MRVLTGLYKTADHCLSKHCSHTVAYEIQVIFRVFVALNGVNMIYRAFCSLDCMMTRPFRELLICRVYLGFTSLVLLCPT